MNPALVLIPIILFICISSIVGIYFTVQENDTQAVAASAELEAKAAEAKAAEAEAAEAEAKAAEAKAASDLAAIEESKVTTRYDVGIRGGPAQSDLVCNNGSFITEVYGGNTEFLDNFGAKCSDGTDLGTKGNYRGGVFNLTSDSGFTKFQASNAVNGIGSSYGLRKVSFYNDSDLINETPLGFEKAGELYFTDCKNPENGGASGKIVGFKLGHGDAIERIQLVCEKRELPSA